MAITFGDQPPQDDEPPARGKGRAASSPKEAAGAVIYQKEARAPRGLKAVYIETLTHARATQAAAELGVNLNDLVEQGLRHVLRQEAAALFEREFKAEQEAAASSLGVTPQRWEFQLRWRGPAWGKNL